MSPSSSSSHIRTLFGVRGWPCGIHEIASHVTRLGLAQALIRPLDDDFLTRLKEFQPHLVGLRVEDESLDELKRWISLIRARHETTIILGGPTATCHPIEVLDRTGADYLFAGDAEESFELFLRLARKPASRQYLSQIPGLAYRWADQTFVNLTPLQSPCQSRREGELPAVTEKTLNENRLDWSILEGFTQKMDSLYFTAGRGCPGNCTFCTRIHGRKIRSKSPGQVIEEIRNADLLVQQGKFQLERWPLYLRTNHQTLRTQPVAWCAIFDEDFFLDRTRALRLLQNFEFFGFPQRYRLTVQTNPCSLLDRQGNPDRELFYWIDRLKVMIQLGAESFLSTRLKRWNKRHSLEQLESVLQAMDRTNQDYNVFQILADYQTDLAELKESALQLVSAARNHPNMRIASCAYMIPLYDTETRRELEFQGRLKITSALDCERAHPEWMPPEVAHLADQLDLALQDALYPERKDQALQKVEEILNATGNYQSTLTK